jgi:hypothetical protein
LPNNVFESHGASRYRRPRPRTAAVLGPRDAGIWPAIHTGRVDRQCSHALARTLAHTHTLGWRQCVTGGEKHGRPGVGGFELESLCHSHSRWPTCQTSIHLPPAASPRRMAICSHGSRSCRSLRHFTCRLPPRQHHRRHTETLNGPYTPHARPQTTRRDPHCPTHGHRRLPLSRPLVSTPRWPTWWMRASWARV